MGLIANVLKYTPFYKSYKKYLQGKADKRQLLLEENLHPIRVKFYKQFVKEGDLVFDIGANVGNRVISFLECKARVVAVEPQPECVQTLKEKFSEKITIENVGLGEKEGELQMHISTDSTVSSFSKEYISSTKERFKYSQWVDVITVPITTLDKLIEKHGLPKFCKIDVEGYELQVLHGLNSKVPYLSLEYCVPEMSQQLNDCVEYLQRLAPDGKFNYSIGESMQWALLDWLEPKVFISHLKSEEFKRSSFGDIYFKAI